MKNDQVRPSEGAFSEMTREQQVDEYCSILRQWVKLAAEAGIVPKDATAVLELPVMKSSYLGRRLYGGEEHRSEPCPKHKGRWCGVAFEETECGCDLTGWLRVGFCTDCRTHNDRPTRFCSNCGKQVRP